MTKNTQTFGSNRDRAEPHGPLWLAARATAFAALCTFGMQPLAASAQATLPITADSNAAARATVGASSNGTQVLNIVAPNAAGVSNNRFTAYNVGTGGLIVNNATQTTQTQIGGTVQANAALGKQGANLILMQVNGGAPSQLLGTTEIAGKGANLVLANPAGITCSGCGFLNAPRVTLATGTPTLRADGSLAGFDVQQGNITVDGNGIKATGSAIDLISRAMTINGQVQGASIDAIAGANRVDYATKTATAQQGTGDKPQVAIDVKALGSMYGNGAVRLVGTEAGVGVRNSGSITSLTGDISVSSNGDVSIGAPAAMKAAGNLAVHGVNVNNEAAMSAHGVDLLADQSLTNSGKLTGDGVRVIGVQTLTNTGSVTSTGDAAIGGNAVTLDGGTIKAGGVVNLNGQNVSNQRGTLSGGNGLNVYAGNLDNSNGTLTSGGDATINAGDTLHNTNGTVTAQRSMYLNGTTLDNSNGKIATTQGALTLQANSNVVNAGGSLTSGNYLAINAPQIDNSKGTISAGSNASIDAHGNVKNTDGTISGGADLHVAGNTIDNTRGHLKSNGNLDAMTNADLISAAGEIKAGGDARINALGALQNASGAIVAGNMLMLGSASLDNTKGSISSTRGPVRIDVREAVDNRNGQITSGDELLANAGTWNNDSGKVAGTLTTALSARGSVSNNGGSITSGTRVSVSGATVSNNGGTISAPQRADIWTNQQNPSGNNSGWVDPNAGTLNGGSAAFDPGPSYVKLGRAGEMPQPDGVPTLVGPDGYLYAYMPNGMVSAMR